MYKLVAQYWKHAHKVEKTIAIYPNKDLAQANREQARQDFKRDWQIDALIVVREVGTKEGTKEAGRVLLAAAVLLSIPACLLLIAFIRIQAIGY